MLSTRRKNSEKRKEKSRYAARARRSRESEIFTEMTALLPLHQTVDKASTMRLAISFIRTRNLVKMCNPERDCERDNTLLTDELDNLGPIDAFLIVLTSDGHIPYISENVEKYLGLKQIDLLGLTIFEFSHPCDHNDIRDALAHKSDSTTSSFLARIKCTITNKGKTINLKSAAYKVIKLTGHWIEDGSCGYLCLLGEPLACPAKIDEPIANQIFLSRHSPDMKFTDIDERFTKILGYEQDDLIGKSVYNLFHALDCLTLSECFKTLFNKGQSETGYYRLLAKRGGYIWIQTQATLITDNHTQQPVSVVCVNYALSGIENQEEIISEEQCQERQKESYHYVDKTDDVLIKLAASTLTDINTDHHQQHYQQLESCNQGQSQGQYLDCQHQQAVPLQPLFTPLAGNSLPTPATATIFAPRTADMNPGFLMPTGDDDNNFGLTVLPDIEACDPDQDLTHLAPQAGDYCVPLEIGPLPSFDAFSMDDILKEMGFVTGVTGTPSSPVSLTSATTTTTTATTNGTSTSPALVSADNADDECIIMEGKSDIIDSLKSSTTKSLPSDSSTLTSPSTLIKSSTTTTTSTKNSLPSVTLVTSDVGENNEKSVDNCRHVAGTSAEEDEESLNYTDYLPSDSKLLPFIPTAVAEEEIQFSCDDVGLTPETRGSLDSTGCVVGDDSCLGDDNSLSDFLCNQSLIETPIINQRSLTTVTTPSTSTTIQVDIKTKQSKVEINLHQESNINNKSKNKDKTGYIRVDSRTDFASGEDNDEDIDGEDDNVSSICSPASDATVASGGSGVGCNSSTGNLLLGMNLNNRHGINGSSSPLHNDPFLSFTNGLGGLVSDNYLCSSSSSTSNSPSNCYISSNRPSSLCDSPPSSSCNSTLTSDLDLCGSFAPDDEDEFDSLGGRSGCVQIDRSIIEKHYDDEFPLLPNDESIWDTFIHSNDINDMINSDELLSSPSTHFPIDDYRLISSSKENANKSSSSSSSSLTTSCSSSSNINNQDSDVLLSESNNDSDGANDSSLLNSNLAMLLQGKDTPFKNGYTLSNGANCNNKQTASQFTPSNQCHQQQQQQSNVTVTVATTSRNRFHNYSANLPRTPSSSTSTSSSSITTTTSCVDSNRINSNCVIVQNNRSTIKTSSNHSNGTKDIIKSDHNLLQNCDMSRNEIDRKADYFTLDSEMKKYRTMADSVCSKLGPNYVKFARKLAFNSSTSSSSSVSPPKRAYLPSKSSMENNFKRMKLPSTLPSMQGTSVLMNLLVNGEDVTNGYSRFQQQSHLKTNSINVNIG